MGAVLGIDLGGTHLRAAAQAGRRVRRFETRPVAGSYPELLAQLGALHDQTRSDLGELSGLAIGLPGVVTEAGGHWIPNLPLLNGEPLAKHLQQRLGLMPRLANDAQMALLGELWMGAARGCASAALLSLGTGIGGAYAVGGRVVRGASGSAGSFGWLGVDPQDPGDPQHGPLERVASGRALERLGAALRPPQTPWQLVAAARQGQPLALKLLEQLAAQLGRAAASLVSVLDPQLLLMSGGLGEAFDLLEAGMQAQLQALASPSGRVVSLSRAALGEFAGVYGALRAARHPARCFV